MEHKRITGLFAVLIVGMVGCSGGSQGSMLPDRLAAELSTACFAGTDLTAFHACEQACGQGDEHACGQLGERLLRGGNGVAVNISRAWPHLATTCIQGIGHSCKLLGDLAGLQGEVSQVTARWYAAGCETDNRVCIDLFAATRQGARPACDAGYGRACNSLEGVSKKQARKMACDRGELSSCFGGSDEPDRDSAMVEHCEKGHPEACVAVARQSPMAPTMSFPLESSHPPKVETAVFLADDPTRFVTSLYNSVEYHTVSGEPVSNVVKGTRGRLVHATTEVMTFDRGYDGYELVYSDGRREVVTLPESRNWRVLRGGRTHNDDTATRVVYVRLGDGSIEKETWRVPRALGVEAEVFTNPDIQTFVTDSGEEIVFYSPMGAAWLNRERQESSSKTVFAEPLAPVGARDDGLVVYFDETRRSLVTLDRAGELSELVTGLGGSARGWSNASASMWLSISEDRQQLLVGDINSDAISHNVDLSTLESLDLDAILSVESTQDWLVLGTSDGRVIVISEHDDLVSHFEVPYPVQQLRLDPTGAHLLVVGGGCLAQYFLDPTGPKAVIQPPSGPAADEVEALFYMSDDTLAVVDHRTIWFFDVTSGQFEDTISFNARNLQGVWFDRASGTFYLYESGSAALTRVKTTPHPSTERWSGTRYNLDIQSTNRRLGHRPCKDQLCLLLESEIEDALPEWARQVIAPHPSTDTFIELDNGFTVFGGDWLWLTNSDGTILATMDPHEAAPTVTRLHTLARSEKDVLLVADFNRLVAWEPLSNHISWEGEACGDNLILSTHILTHDARGFCVHDRTNGQVLHAANVDRLTALDYSPSGDFVAVIDGNKPSAELSIFTVPR